MPKAGALAFAQAPDYLREPPDPSGANLTPGPGRPKGIPDTIPRSSREAQNEAKTFALSILRSPEYRKSLMDRARAGTLPANIESMLWAYGYGRPTERVEVTHVSPAAQLAELPVSELATRAELIGRVLREVGDVEAAEMALKLQHEAEEKRQLQTIDAEILSRSDATVQ